MSDFFVQTLVQVEREEGEGGGGGEGGKAAVRKRGQGCCSEF